MIASRRAAERGTSRPEQVAPGRERRLGYVPALDGARGVAIALVVSYHAFGSPVGGFLGVHVFFVLSGFLITSLLLDERRRTGGISLRSFYARRALRLFPALFVFIAVYVAVQSARELATPHELALRPALTGALAALLYVSNIVQAAGTHLAVSVTHLWSLAAEEQFYLVWPLALVSLLAAGARRRAVQLVLVAAIVILALHTLRLTLADVGWRRLYYGPDTAFIPLLIGCLAGVWFVTDSLPRPLRARGALPVLAAVAGIAVAVMVATIGVQSDVLYGGALTGFGAAVAVLVLLVVTRPDSPPARALRVGPLVYLGRISYSLYLWHLIALELVRRALDGPAALGVVVGVVAAATSYHIVELPFLRRKRRVRDRLEHEPPRTREAQAAQF